jgi:hypothetical protein
MATAYSPSIVTNGLVFYYDMSNTQKSWRGKPATNTNSFGTFDYGYNSTKISNATPPTPPPITGYPIYKITSNDGNDSQQILYTATVDAVNGGTYTHSAYVYLESGTWVSAGQHWNPWDYGTQQFIPQGVWTRIEDPVTNSPGNYGAVALCYNTNGAVYVTASQYELGSVASPFITQSNGVRSNTQAIVDLTNNTTMTASSLTYASDGTFSFNAISDYIDLNTSMPSMVGDISYSLMAWVKINSNRPAGGVTVGSSCIVGHNDALGFGLQIDTGNYVNFGLRSTGNWNGATPLALNTWYHVAGVKNALGNSFIYVNGVQDGINAGSPASVIGTTTTIRVGYGPGRNPAPFDGSISQVQIYNRALSATEIQQNFTAHRGRYGI